MRIPFIHRKEEDIRSLARRATYVGSAEAAWPRQGRAVSHEEYRAALERVRRRRANGGPPS